MDIAGRVQVLVTVRPEFSTIHAMTRDAFRSVNQTHYIYKIGGALID